MNIFDLKNKSAWQQWADQKKQQAATHIEQLIVEVNDLNAPSKAEINKIKQLCQQHNMAIFNLKNGSSASEQNLLKFGLNFGLKNLQHNEGADQLGISHITVQQQWRKTYIPYTNKPISWHTDGYYNRSNEQINGMILYCQNPAFEGGESALLDHDLAYIYLREKGAQYIKALSDPKAMMIPANDVADHIQRPDCYGAVFSVKQNGQLHMRYSARKRNIVWQNDPITTEAVQYLKDFMADAANPWILKATLQAGQGLICNNVLHNRATFTDAPDHQRLLYRLRYFDGIDTNL